MTEYGANSLPKGVSDGQFRRILNAADLAYKTKGSGELLPSIDKVATLAGVHRNTVTRFVTSLEGKEALLKRGIRWTTNVNIAGVLTPEQVLAVSIITDPTNRKPMGEKLKQVGISMATYRAWMKNPTFASKMNELGETLLNENIAAVHARLVNRAEGGDVSAMKLFYEVSGRHDPAQKQMVDLVRVVQLVLEVITRYVTDPETLGKVNQDIDTILSGGVPKALSDLPNNYIPRDTVAGEVIDDAIQRDLDDSGDPDNRSTHFVSDRQPPRIEEEVPEEISGAVVHSFLHPLINPLPIPSVEIPADFFELKDPE